jgi:hypothetical protein
VLSSELDVCISGVRVGGYKGRDSYNFLARSRFLRSRKVQIEAYFEKTATFTEISANN